MNYELELMPNRNFIVLDSPLGFDAIKNVLVTVKAENKLINTPTPRVKANPLTILVPNQ